MAWIFLLIASGLEIFWATFMKLSHGFTQPLYTALTVGGLIASFLFLARATKVLPLGTAYAIWTCIGYTVLLCFTLFKTSSLSKSIFNAH